MPEDVIQLTRLAEILVAGHSFLPLSPNSPGFKPDPENQRACLIGGVFVPPGRRRNHSAPPPGPARAAEAVRRGGLDSGRPVLGRVEQPGAGQGVARLSAVPPHDQDPPDRLADPLECCERNYDSAPALRRRFPPDCRAGADPTNTCRCAGPWPHRPWQRVVIARAGGIDALGHWPALRHVVRRRLESSSLDLDQGLRAARVSASVPSRSSSTTSWLRERRRAPPRMSW